MSKNALVGIVVIVMVGLVVWFFGYYLKPSQTAQPEPTNTVQLETKSNSLGEQIYTQTANPVGEQLPSTNPVEQVSTPFSGYTNPFDTK